MAKRRTLRLDELEPPDFERVPPEVGRLAMPEIVKVVAKKTRQLAPDSGRRHAKKLKSCVRYRVRKKGEEGVVAVQAPHAHLVHNGTQAHWITARKTLLAVPVAGRVRYKKRVWHPGAKAQPFLPEALHQSGREINRILDRAGETVEVAL